MKNKTILPVPVVTSQPIPLVSRQEERDTYIELYNGKGVSMTAEKRVGNPTGKGGGKRGKITGWTTASRKRMRHYMLTHRPKYEKYLGVSFTIPGPPIGIIVAQRAFKAWCIASVKLGVCAIWRLEIQKRGQLHWHMIVGLPDHMTEEELKELWFHEVRRLGAFGVEYNNKLHGGAVKYLREDEDFWFEHEEIGTEVKIEGAGGEIDRDVVFSTVTTIIFSDRMKSPGASLYCAEIQSNGNTGAWMRYLQDHATKRKQEQIVDGVGRHWGVIGRKHFVQCMPDESYRMSNPEYCRVVRWMQRLATPRILDNRDPFGRRKGFSPSRGRWGTSVWFSHAETVKRMIALSIQNTEWNREPKVVRRLFPRQRSSAPTQA